MLLSACSGASPHQPAGVHHVDVNGVVVEVRPDDTGGWRACVTALAGARLPDRALCVGPHRGEAGPGAFQARADRVGPVVVVLGLTATSDVVTADGVRTQAVTGVPVAVVAGLQHRGPAGAVCLTDRSAGRTVTVAVGVTSSGPAQVVDGGCAARARSRWGDTAGASLPRTNSHAAWIGSNHEPW